MKDRELARRTASPAAEGDGAASEGHSSAGGVPRWRSRVAKAAPLVLLVVGLASLIVLIYASSVRGQPWLAGGAALAVPGLLVALLRHVLPRAGSGTTLMGTDTEPLAPGRSASERIRELAALAEVAHATTSVLEPSVLLPRVVELVRDRFGLYYVGLFLVDEEHRFATLEAGTGAAGREMRARNHRLEVGGESMIGQCVATGKVGVQLDVRTAEIRFDNPLLPRTRSELALPLRVRERVIGALTVQGEQANAFDETRVGLLQTMADQVAVAIDNARLFSESRAAVSELQAIQRRYTVSGWREYLATGTENASVTVGVGGLAEDAVATEIRTALANRATTVIPAPAVSGDTAGQRGYTALVLPITLRDRTIGALGVHGLAERSWSESDIALAEAIVERLAIAAENLRLLDETQRRAARERLTAEVGQQVREAPDLQEIMHVAATALGRELGASEVVLRLGTAERLLGTEHKG